MTLEMGAPAQYACLRKGKQIRLLQLLFPLNSNLKKEVVEIALEAIFN